MKAVTKSILLIITVLLCPQTATTDSPCTYIKPTLIDTISKVTTDLTTTAHYFAIGGGLASLLGAYKEGLKGCIANLGVTLLSYSTYFIWRSRDTIHSCHDLIHQESQKYKQLQRDISQCSQCTSSKQCKSHSEQLAKITSLSEFMIAGIKPSSQAYQEANWCPCCQPEDAILFCDNDKFAHLMIPDLDSDYINFKKANWLSALQLAIVADYPNIVQLLLDNGAAQEEAPRIPWS